jgi:hydrogenase nickel incorporation protein HypA/HybF
MTMHEYSIVTALLEQVERHAKQHDAIAVRQLKVQIGELAGVEPILLQTAWEMFREHSLCAGAPLQIESVAAVWLCPRCGAEIAPGVALRCLECQVPARLSAGGEIVLSSIELEVA